MSLLCRTHLSHTGDALGRFSKSIGARTEFVCRRTVILTLLARTVIQAQDVLPLQGDHYFALHLTYL